ncbi:MAG: AAA family ATPase [Verrucomicrobiales bacterium]|nr:AAA family ATPase [Verrucomicrobiales bacterium]
MNQSIVVTSPPSETGDSRLAIGRRLLDGVLAPLKSSFVGKDVIIDLMGICLVAGENLFILGPPGTAKSALVHELGRRLQINTFEYLLTRFTEPNELFGPFDIRRLREGDLVTNTEGMLPEANLVFLDELLNANSAILNSLLTVLNERKLRRGREIMELPLLMGVGASNHLPEEEALQALFDRFILRVVSDNVDSEHLGAVLEAGWKLDAAQKNMPERAVSLEEIIDLRSLVTEVSLEPVISVYIDLVKRLRSVGVEISDRRAVKLQRLIAASALLCGRMQAQVSDLWIMQHIWDLDEQRELLSSAVTETMEAAAEEGERSERHPQAAANDEPDAEQISSDLDQIGEELDRDEPHVSSIRDRLALLEGRSQFVKNDEQRSAIAEKIVYLWSQIKP